jgi:hypothetical protein
MVSRLRSADHNGRHTKNGRSPASHLSLEGRGNEELDRVVHRAVERLQQDDTRPAPFPLEVFPDKLRQYVEERATALPCPPDYLGTAVLVVAGSFVGAHRPLRVKPGWDEYAVLYALIVASAGSRKSAALKAALIPARKRDRRLARGYRAKAAAFEKEMEAHRKGGGEGVAPKAPRVKQHTTTDTTIEALAEVLQANPRGVLMVRDEATAWVTSMNQYKSGKGSDRQFWLSAWSCEDFNVNRARQPLRRILRPFVSVVGNIPPDMLSELYDRQGRDDGFIDRVLFSFPGPVEVHWTDRAADPELEAAYVGACHAIAGLKPATLTLDDGAQRCFAQWYDEHNKEARGPAGNWAKFDGYCARLANILHHLHLAYEPRGLTALQRDRVPRQRVEEAIQLIDYFKNHALRALSIMKVRKEGNKLARLLALVISSPKATVYPRALITYRLAHTTPEARKMLEQLEALGLGEMVQGKRRDEVYFRGKNNLEYLVNTCEEVDED